MAAALDPRDRAMMEAYLAGQPIEDAPDELEQFRQEQIAANAPPMAHAGPAPDPRSFDAPLPVPPQAAAPPAEAVAAQAQSAPAPRQRMAPQRQPAMTEGEQALAAELATYAGEPGDEYTEQEFEEDVADDVPEGLLPAGAAVQRNAGKPTRLERADIEESRDAQFAAEQDIAEIAPFSADAERKAKEVAAHGAGQIRQEFLDKEEQRLNAERRALDDYRSIATELRNEPIESPSLWTGNTGQDILRGIGIMLMGLGGGDAYGMIRDIMNDGLEKQKREREAKKGDLETRGTMIDIMRNRFADERTADAAARTAALQKLEDELSVWMDAAKSPETKARAELAIAQAREDRIKSELEFRKAYSDSVTVSMAPPKPATGGGGPSRSKILKEAVEERDLIRNLESGGPAYVKGYGPANSEQDAKQARELLIAQSELEKDLKELQRLRKDGWVQAGIGQGQWVGSDAYQKAQEIQRRMTSNMAKIEAGGGVPSDTERQAGKEMVPDATSIAPGAFDTAVRVMMERMTNKRDATLRQLIPSYADKPASFERVD